MENNIELGGIQAKIQSQGSSFDSRRREVRRRRFQSSEYSTRKRSNNDHALEEESASQPLLLILRILSYHKIRLFSVNPNQRWNLRQALGDGSTFSVDGAELPIWDALAHLRYRNLDIKGPKEKFNFVDHTRISWQHTTLVAYKALVGRKSMDRGMIMQDLITELRVLCHRPLQKHPNFVRLLGVAWISEIDMGYTDDAEPREWPTVVVEKAPHGSLLDFLSSEEFKTTRSSLMAKLNLCIDVLIAIVALHACDILHGDIKCENALVFNTEKGTAENWRVKLSDFGHAILNMQGKGSSGFTRREVIGTDFYSPPELSSAEAVIDVANMKSVDVWCWGLLMWRVLIDGMEYSDAEGHQIDPGAMRALREQGNIAATAKDACKNYLNLHHSREGAALSSIVGILVDALSHNAADRPDALSLLSRLRRASSDREAEAVENLVPEKPQSIESLEALPFFNLTQYYYDLWMLLAVPRDILIELQSLHAVDADGSLEATFQLGLCHVAGFGVQRDGQQAVDLVKRAAEGGLSKARLALPRIAGAFGVALSPETRQLVISWLIEASRNGPGIAWMELERLGFEQRILGPSELLRTATNIAKSPHDSGLLHAVKLGDEEAVRKLSTHGSFPGQFGETPLHCATLLPKSVGLPIAEILLKGGANIYQPTSRQYQLSRDDFILEAMPEHTTPLEWAIINDRVSFVRLFLEFSESSDLPSEVYGSTTTPLAYAARHQSIKCLKYLCNEHGRSNADINTFDKYGFSAFYYAVRPDLLDRVLRYVPEERDGPTRSDISPVVAREESIINMLVASGSDMKVSSAGHFNCLHLITAFGEPSTLEAVLNIKGSDLLVNQESQYGWTPLVDAIFWRRKDSFKLLLEHHASPKDIWPKTKRHAIHTCCLLPNTSSALFFAETLLHEHPSCLHARDTWNRTPLHFAAIFGKLKLIDLYLSKGAKLLVFDIHRITPLGLAVEARSMRGVRRLRDEHDSRNLPLLGFKTSSLSPRYFSVFHFLLQPGGKSPTYVRNSRVPSPYPGCADHPFSGPSLNVLDDLLSHYKYRVSFGINFIESIVHSPYKHESGIREAVQMANWDAVDMILKSGKFTVDLRHLLKIAFDQRILGSGHFASEDARKKMVKYLWQEQEEEYQALYKTRQTSLMRFLWRYHYRMYGTMEQEQYQRVNQWLFDNRYLWHKPMFPDLDLWVHTRLPVTLILSIFVGCLLCPLLVCLAIITADPATQYGTRNKGRTGVMVFCTSTLLFFPQMLRGLTIAYCASQKTLKLRSWQMRLVQSVLCLAVPALGVFNIWILNPENANIVRFHPKYSLAKGVAWDARVLPPWRQNILGHFFRLCDVLLAWSVIAYVVFPVIILGTWWITTFNFRKTPRLDVSEVSLQKTYVTSRRGWPWLE